MARGSWDDLSPTYRARLTRGGITRESYDSGVSLKAARGHALTPEHPGEAENQPSRYQRYRTRKNELIDRIERLKYDKWGTSPDYNADSSRKSVRRDGDGHERGIRELIKIQAAMQMAIDDDLDWHYLVDIDEDLKDALYYH